MIMKPKVFGIGFHKTGTTSLANALYTLGYNVTGYFGVHDPDISKNVYQTAFELADRFDAAQDTPWPVLYKELDQRYPGSKFILTTRPSDEWFKSVVKHFRLQRIPAHEWIYGVHTAFGNRRIYVQRYEKHNREVQEYFQDRPQDLLVMDITHGEGWEVLCPFLNLEVPAFEFPSKNISGVRKSSFRIKANSYLQRLLPWILSPKSDSQMQQGVSAAFVRDILHFHYAMYQELWDCALELSTTQFMQTDTVSTNSICSYFLQQITEEVVWLRRLMGERKDWDAVLAPKEYTKESVYAYWKHIRLMFRKFTADLSDADCNAHVGGANIYIWEVFIHLLNFGRENLLNIQQALQMFGKQIERSSFIDFFR